MAESFKFELVSPERLLLSADVTAVVIPGTLGEMTVMASHAPVMTTLKAGIVTVTTADSNEDKYVVFGGFADILPSSCTVLAESAIHIDELTEATLIMRIEAAKAELESAEVHERRSAIEDFIFQLTDLRGAVSG
jgi:F-type H+-transporting ATPase subunit epsilon